MYVSSFLLPSPLLSLSRPISSSLVVPNSCSPIEPAHAWAFSSFITSLSLPSFSPSLHLHFLVLISHLSSSLLSPLLLFLVQGFFPVTETGKNHWPHYNPSLFGNKCLPNPAFKEPPLNILGPAGYYPFPQEYTDADIYAQPR